MSVAPPPVPGTPRRSAVRTTLGFKDDILPTLMEGWRRHGDIVGSRASGRSSRCTSSSIRTS